MSNVLAESDAGFPWLAGAMLALESCEVIHLRLAKLAIGDHDAGCEAAYLARELGRPVRVQWMRSEETAWDTKAPAYAVKLKLFPAAKEKS